MENNTASSQPRSHARCVARRGVALQFAALVSIGCSSYAVPAELSSPPQSTNPRQEVMEVTVVDQAGFDEMRKSGKYQISEPRGDVSGSAPCASGDADEACVEAARQRLREAAVQRAANLVVVVSAAISQSFPVRYTVRGVLYVITPRS
jgi:hypothetical protein